MRVFYVKVFYPGLIVPEDSLVRVESEDAEFCLPDGAFAFQRGWREEVTQDGEKLIGELHLDKTMWYRHGKVFNLKEAMAKWGCNSILVSNMKCNRYERVVDTGYGVFPLEEDCVVLSKGRRS
jgi:hypothetical protein